MSRVVFEELLSTARLLATSRHNSAVIRNWSATVRPGTAQWHVLSVVMTAENVTEHLVMSVRYHQVKIFDNVDADMDLMLAGMMHCSKL